MQERCAYAEGGYEDNSRRGVHMLEVNNSIRQPRHKESIESCNPIGEKCALLLVVKVQGQEQRP